jgi:hypothetical protein
MASGVKFSQNWDAVRKRIKALPRFAQGVADMQRKRDAQKLISYWRSGIMGNTLGLFALSPQTVARKMANGYAHPNSPLYGLGLEGSRTYIKGMRAFKTSRGYTVKMINGRHHSSKLSLASLFIVHEYGTTIRGAGGKIIRIPARPAMTKAYQKVIREISRADDSRDLKKACTEYLKSASSGTAKTIQSRANAAEGRNHG